jgi:hypothetical protein
MTPRSAVFGVQKFLAHLVGALHLDHPGDFGHRVDVAVLQKALQQDRALGRLSVAGENTPCRPGAQRTGSVGLPKADLARGWPFGRKRAICGQRHIARPGGMKTGAPPASSRRWPSG